MVSERDRELLALVQLDYQQTSEFVRGVLSTGATIRGWAITVWLALVGFSVEQEEPVLAVLGAVVVAVFFVVDGYHLHLYRQALGHVRAMERLYADYYGALSRSAVDDEVLDEFRIELETYAFGFYRRLSPFDLRALRRVKPRVFVWLYGLLLLVALLAAALEALLQ